MEMEQVWPLIAKHPWQFWTLVVMCAFTFLWVLADAVDDEAEKRSESERREEIEGYCVLFVIAVAVVFLVSVFKTGYYVWSEKDMAPMIGATIVVTGGIAALAVLLAAWVGAVIAQSLVWFFLGVAVVFRGVRAVVLFFRDDLGLGQAWQTTIGWIRRFRERSRQLMKNRSHG